MTGSAEIHIARVVGLPRKPSAVMGKDLPRHPPPTAKLDFSDPVLSSNPSGNGAVTPEAPSHPSRANDRNGSGGGVRCGGRAREHPDRSHEPHARPDVPVEEVLKLLRVDVAVCEQMHAHGETLNRDQSGSLAGLVRLRTRTDRPAGPSAERFASRVLPARRCAARQPQRTSAARSRGGRWTRCRCARCERR